MRPTRKLSAIHKRVLCRLYGLSQAARIAEGQPFSEADKILAHTTIEAITLWNAFCRAYFLSCTLQPMTNTGNVITLGNASVQSFSDAIVEAIKVSKPHLAKKAITGAWTRKDEPAWHLPHYFIRACQAIDCSNYNNILTAFSIQTSAFQHLTTARNFYAHRNSFTVSEIQALARSYSIQSKQHPSFILLSLPYNGSQTLILDWFDDMRIVTNLLCS